MKFGLKMTSRKHGDDLKSFVEVICFNLTEHQPVTIHGEPIRAIFGQKDMKCRLVQQEDISCLFDQIWRE